MLRLRDQRYHTLSQTSKQILGPNTRRHVIVITAPPSLPDEQTYSNGLAPAVDTSTTGIKLAYTVPVGQQGLLLSATFVETTGTGVVAALQVVRGVTTYTIYSATTLGYFGGFALQPGDTVQWNVTTAVASSVSDFTISAGQDQASQRITISFIGPAVVDQGINLQPGTLPLVLSEDQWGDSLTGPIYAIANAGSPVIGVLDVFGCQGIASLTEIEP